MLQIFHQQFIGQDWLQENIIVSYITMLIIEQTFIVAVEVLFQFIVIPWGSGLDIFQAEQLIIQNSSVHPTWMKIQVFILM